MPLTTTGTPEILCLGDEWPNQVVISRHLAAGDCGSHPQVVVEHTMGMGEVW